MGLSLLEFGNQINRARLELDSNFDLLENEKFKQHLFYRVLRYLMKYEKPRKRLKEIRDEGGMKDIIALARFKYEEEILLQVKSYEYFIFSVNFFWVYLFEYLFHISQMYNEMDMKKRKIWSDELKIVFDILNKKWQKAMYFDPLFGEKFSTAFVTLDGVSIKSDVLSQMPNSDTNFDLVFAMTLRQMPIRWMDNFLLYQQTYFDTGEKYLRFLKDILIEYSSLISSESKIKIKDWLKDQEDVGNLSVTSINADKVEIKASQTNISSPKNVNFPDIKIATEKDEPEFDENWVKGKEKESLQSKVGFVEGGSSTVDLTSSTSKILELKTKEGGKEGCFSNDPFKNPDFEFERICVKEKNVLSTDSAKIIRKFLSFIKLETNGDDLPFTSDEELINHLETYGLVVPSEPLKERFTLDLVSDKRSQKVFLYIVNKFRLKYKLDKGTMCKWLKHTFTNFDNRGKGKDPYSFLRSDSLPKQYRNFDISKYI